MRDTSRNAQEGIGDRAGSAAASLFSAGKRRRGSLADCMIAGAALVAGARLATNNRAEFARFEERGLLLDGI